jgi:hypothetical protein
MDEQKFILFFEKKVVEPWKKRTCVEGGLSQHNLSSMILSPILKLRQVKFSPLGEAWITEYAHNDE